MYQYGSYGNSAYYCKNNYSKTYYYSKQDIKLEIIINNCTYTYLI